jgi:CheY-like chemotaxis protein
MNLGFNWLNSWRKPQTGLVATLIAMADPEARRMMRQAVGRVVAADVVEVDDKQHFYRTVTFNEIDLIIADAEMKGCCGYEIAEEIRFGRVHCHPFPVIVMLCGGAEGVRNPCLVDCGADLLLPAASAVGAIIEPLRKLAQQRKPFVVSAHYIGPERRSAARQGEPSAEQIVVPNPLIKKSCATAVDDYRRQLSFATRTVNQVRRGLYSLRTPNAPRSGDKDIILR